MKKDGVFCSQFSFQTPQNGFFSALWKKKKTQFQQTNAFPFFYILCQQVAKRAKNANFFIHLSGYYSWHDVHPLSMYVSEKKADIFSTFFQHFSKQIDLKWNATHTHIPNSGWHFPQTGFYLRLTKKWSDEFLEKQKWKHFCHQKKDMAREQREKGGRKAIVKNQNPCPDERL